MVKSVRWKPPVIRYWPFGQRAVAVLVSPVRMKTVLCGEGLAGTRPRAQTVWRVTLRGVVEPGLAS